MKIGIITLSPELNYGGILQAYALCRVLSGMGHEPEVICIRKRWALPWHRKPWAYTKRAVKKYILRRPAWIHYEEKVEREWPILVQHTIKFVEKYISRHEYESYCYIQPHDYDGFIVGSDQVWRPYYFGGDIADAYLRFTQGWNVKRIAYAASFGVDDWQYNSIQTRECSQLAKSFDAISVRELSGVDLCRKHLGIEALHMADPTLLLSAADYETLIADLPVSHQQEILNYILDWNDAKRQLVEDVETTTGMHSFRVNSRYEEWDAPTEERIQPSVESWLQGFRDASMVLTDSFHACVFSIIFCKPFYVVGNKKRGLTRITSLLAAFGLEDRLVDSITSIDLSASIDWGKVNEKKEKMRNVALKFLTEACAGKQVLEHSET